MTAEHTALIRAILGKVQQGINLRLYKVSATAAGAATDGHTQISIAVGTGSVPAAYLDSYTSPVVGDTVMVLTVAGSPFILGRVIGFPTL